MVAAQAHQKGSRKSATNPSNMKTTQNIFFCIGAIVSVGQPGSNSQALPKLDVVCRKFTSRRVRALAGGAFGGPAPHPSGQLGSDIVSRPSGSISGNTCRLRPAFSGS